MESYSVHRMFNFLCLSAGICEGCAQMVANECCYQITYCRDEGCTDKSKEAREARVTNLTARGWVRIKGILVTDKCGRKA